MDTICRPAAVVDPGPGRWHAAAFGTLTKRGCMGMLYAKKATVQADLFAWIEGF